LLNFFLIFSSRVFLFNNKFTSKYEYVHLNVHTCTWHFSSHSNSGPFSIFSIFFFSISRHRDFRSLFLIFAPLFRFLFMLPVIFHFSSFSSCPSSLLVFDLFSYLIFSIPSLFLSSPSFLSSFILLAFFLPFFPLSFFLSYFLFCPLFFPPFPPFFLLFS
jgi:hypothetical protein